MDVTRIATATELAAIADDWNRLASDVPFRRAEWLGGWWRHYGGSQELYVLAVRERGELIGLAPWWLDRSRARGRVLRFLGSGEVCSDYLGVLAMERRAEEVAAALADWLQTAAQAHRPLASDRWDLLRLEGVAADDTATLLVRDELVRRGSMAHTSPSVNCWRLELPGDWRQYQASLSKSHRKQVRRLEERVLDAGRAVLHTVKTAAELSGAWEILVDLHQRRRRSLGEPGCFASPRFAAFHREAAERLLAVQSLRLHWLELEGVPVAAEYHLAAGRVIYGYQAGVDPDRLEDEPGRLAAIATLRLAVEEGFSAFDFLRGDEPYKAHWRAEPRRTHDLHIAAPRPIARLRQAAWQAGQQVKRWAKGGAMASDIEQRTTKRDAVSGEG